MVAFFDPSRRTGINLKDDEVLDLLGDGNLTDIDEFHDDDEELQPQFLEELDMEDIPLVDDPPAEDAEEGAEDDAGEEPTHVPSTSSQRRRPAQRKRVWKQMPFQDKPHEFPTLPTRAVRLPIEYFRDYFDQPFFEEVARCTNLYYFRKSGKELKATADEIMTMFSIHMIMGCIPYPRIPMYWRQGMNLELVSAKMSRDRFLAMRNAFHVVDSDDPKESEKDNPLWKIQPMINQVKQTCNRLERVPGYYSIDEQMIPFTGRCQLRQVVKNKPRPVGLKNFVMATSEGLMLDFEIYRGAKTMFGNTSLGLGPSVILHLVQTIPHGSCVFHDRYFTTIPLIEEMEKLKLHSTGTIMMNRIPDRAAMKFKKDSTMKRGESQEYVCQPTVVVKWKDNKSVLMASNCTGASTTTQVKRWDKQQKAYIDVDAPKVIQQYNQHMGGIDVIDQQMEYYRSFLKTKKWTLKCLIHFVDLALTNSWRLYKNDCTANELPRKKTLPLLDFRMEVAEALIGTPARTRQEVDDGDEAIVPSGLLSLQYRPVIKPTESKRYDGFVHLPVVDRLNTPRSCRYEGCVSRSKTRCQKCETYLCLSRFKNCFAAFHSK